MKMQIKMQKELREGELKVRIKRDQGAREDSQRRHAEREKNLVAKTKRYVQAVQYALTNMPAEVGELPPWFDMVDNVWTTYGVPEELKSKLIIPKLSTRAKSLLTHLPVSDQASYPKLKVFLLKHYQLGSRKYRAGFLHATRIYYTNLWKFNYNDFDGLFGLCVAAWADANAAWTDGRYKGLSITAGQSGHKWRPNVSEQLAKNGGAKFCHQSTGCQCQCTSAKEKSASKP